MLIDIKPSTSIESTVAVRLFQPAQFKFGRRQVVRHLVLVQTFRGSNPCAPVSSFHPEKFYEIIQSFT